MGDLVRYRYLHYQREGIAEAKFDEYWKLIENPDLRVLALAERVHFLIDRKDFVNATLRMQVLTKQLITTNTESALQMAYLRLMYEQGLLEGDFKEKAEGAAYPHEKIGLKSLYLGAYYAKQQQHDKAVAMYQEAIAKLPFTEVPYLGLAQAFKAQNKLDDAYQALLKGTFTYPNSSKMLQAYILNCLELRYDSYAEYAMEDLKKMIPAADYQAFLSVYQAKKAEVEKQAGTWQ
jgi:tetratricopeptide (TPR) repeat protein